MVVIGTADEAFVSKGGPILNPESLEDTDADADTGVATGLVVVVADEVGT